MRHTLIHVLLGVTVLLGPPGCVTPRGSSVGHTPNPGDAELRFVTVCHGCDSPVGLPGVEVTAVGASGSLTVLGKTDDSGDISVPKALLRRLETSHLLFCLPGFECSAVRIGPDKRLLAYDEYPVSMVVHSLF